MNLDQARVVLSQHARSSKNGRLPKMQTHEGKLTNPLCGDHVDLRLYVNEGKIQEACFSTRACAICTASASLLCAEILGLSAEKALASSMHFETSLLASPEEAWPRELAGLLSFEHLKVNPSRRVCAMLPWIALRNSLKEFAPECPLN